MTRRVLTILIGIVMLAAFLRVWQLGNVPPSPDWDEVALGYDAYSIIHTGKDEFGNFLPVVLRSFDDYKPALYTYLAIPSVLVFGLSTFALRFPSAVLGVISVIAVFFLVKELFEKHRHRDSFALVSSFLFAISPWSIQFSRVGFEANIGDGLNILMALFFIKGLKKPWLLSLSAVFAGLSLYAYQSEKVFVPLLVVALALTYRDKLSSLNKKYIISAILVGLVVVLPMFSYILTNRAALLRVTGTSIFSYKTELLKTNIQKLERDRERNDFLGLALDNRRLVYAKTIVAGYISHFDPNWLFITGDISRHHAPGMGILYIYEFPFILLGIYLVLFGKFERKTKLVILAWLLLAPIPASITTGVPHAVRTLNFLPTWQIIGAIGLVSAWGYVRQRKLRHLIYGVFLLIFLLNTSYYLNQYFVQLNYYDAKDWQYGYREAVEEVLKRQDKYNSIVISDRQPMDKSYMFFLFYLKYPPQNYQEIGEDSSGGYDSHHSFGKYTFRPINWQEDSGSKNILFVGTPDEIPSGTLLKKTIYNPDGSVAIRIAGT